MKNLKKHVTCSICLDTYTNPKTIACLHTFCCNCLERHARTSARNGKFLCPECQAEMTLPDKNRFDKLPTSFHQNSLLSVLGVQQVGKLLLKIRKFVSALIEVRLEMKLRQLFVQKV